MSNSILEDHQNDIIIVTLNRPEVLNAWDQPMRKRLVDILVAAARDESVRAVVLSGAGDRAFCAGQDLREAVSFDATRAEAWIKEWAQLFGAIRSLPKPLIIALNGLAVGSAFQVALLADYRVGHHGVRMGQPEINSGIPSITGAWIMREVLGLARTTDLVLSGRLMDAEECHQIGIINRLVDQDKILAEALRVAENLSKKDPETIRTDKQWLQEMTESGFQACLEAAVKFHRQAYASGTATAQIGRFLNRDG